MIGRREEFVLGRRRKGRPAAGARPAQRRQRLVKPRVSAPRTPGC